MTIDRRQQPSRRIRRLAVRHGAERGFTLIEMIVALAAGLMISAAAFLMARNASRFFQSESGITSAQFQSVVGMTRMQADLRRVSFMSTPNVDVDPKFCGGTAGWPAGMLEMAGLRLENGGSPARHSADHGLSTFNGLTPDAMIITGNYGTTEQFAVQAVATGGGGLVVHLQDDGAMWRAKQRAQEGGSALDEIFRAGRFLRILDQEGRFGYGVITGVNTATPNVEVSVANTPTMPTRLNNGLCGCEGFCTGAIVNPVVRMLYDLRRIDDTVFTQYQGLYARSGHANTAFHRGPAEPARTELVRIELDQADNEIVTSLEVLAEFAVDLKFGITEDLANLGQPPNLQRRAIGSAAVYNAANTLAASARPDRIRAVQIRLSTRAYRSDREVGLPPLGTDLGLLRYGLGTDLGFVRMRTLIADVQLPNQQRQVL
jgi:prepilin-type N-terminal cleavage/methylation domain-containing protein